MPEIFSYPFMQKALIAGAITGFLGSYYGVFIVQRKMSFMGTGLAHSAFGGVALGLLLGTQPLIIAVPFTVLVAVLIIYLRDRTGLEPDTSIGILFSVSVALGILFLALKENYTVDAFTYLFGSILAVKMSDIWISAGIAVISVITIFTHWKRWAYASFDPELARSDKNPVKTDDYFLSILAAVTIVVSIKIVGIILISAFIVIPAAIARLLSDTFFGMTIKSVIIGFFTATGGLILSYILDVPSGAAIILLQALIFLIAAIFKNTFAK